MSIDFSKASHYAINLQGSNLLDEVKLVDVHRLKKFPEAIGFSLSALIKPEAATVDINGTAAPVTSSRPKVLFFTQQNNPACQNFVSVLQEAQNKFGSNFDFQTIDIASAEGKALVDQYHVTTAPDLYVIDTKGQISQHLTGVVPIASLTDALQKAGQVATTSDTK
jgi:thiol-disulfide isomerase/thioredoxin